LNFVVDDGIVAIRALQETWKEEVLSLAGERFERRLSEELATFRVEMAKEFAAMSGMMAFLIRALGPR
jgi:hypothetical protein